MLDVKGNGSELQAFRNAVIFTACIASTDKSIERFTALSFETFGDTFGMTSTDRFRLGYATGDGSEIGAFKDAKDSQFVGLVPAREILKAIGTKPARFFRFCVDKDAGIWSLEIDDTTTSGRTIMGDFIKWRGILPIDTGESVDTVLRVDPVLFSGLLAGIAKAFGKVKKENCAVALQQYKVNGAIVLSGFSDSASAIMMPVRGA